MLVSETERAWVWRSDNPVGVELLVGYNHGRRCRMLHESYAICVVPFGGNENTLLTRWKYRGREYVYRPGAIGVEMPGEVHECLQVYSPIRYCMLRVTPSLLEAYAGQLGIPRVYFPVPLTCQEGLYESFAAFYRAAAGEAGTDERHARLFDFLRRLLAESREPGPYDPPRTAHRSVERARDYLVEHFDEPVGLEDLSKVAGLSRFHLSRMFTETYGLSPHAYQNQLRLRTVRDRLRHGWRVDAIEAGFFDRSHMARHFRDSLGTTPGEFASSAAPLPPLD